MEKKIRSHNTGYCLIEVVTKAGLTVVMICEYSSTDHEVAGQMAIIYDTMILTVY
jgi:hypothetical protein